MPSTLPPSSFLLLLVHLLVPTLLLCKFPFHSHFSKWYTLYLHVPSVHPVSACPFITPCICMSLQYILYLHVPSVHSVSACPFTTPCTCMSLQYTCICMSLQYTLYLHVPSVHLYLHVPSAHPVSAVTLNTTRHRPFHLQSPTPVYPLDVPI
jgi:hypothetical protein